MNVHGSNLRTGHKSVRSFWKIHKIRRNIVLKFTFSSFTDHVTVLSGDRVKSTHEYAIKLNVHNG